MKKVRSVAKLRKLVFLTFLVLGLLIFSLSLTYNGNNTVFAEEINHTTLSANINDTYFEIYSLDAEDPTELVSRKSAEEGSRWGKK